MNRPIRPSQPSLFGVLESSNLQEKSKEIEKINLEGCEDEIYGQIWSKALRLQSLDKNRSGENWRDGYYERFLNLITNNNSEINVYLDNGSTRKRKKDIVKRVWRPTCLSVNDEGFSISVAIKEDTKSEEPNAPLLNIEFKEPTDLQISPDEMEVFKCIVEGMENEDCGEL